MMLTFGLLKQILTDAVTDADFVRKNTILSDGVTKQALTDRIAALQTDYPIRQTFAEAGTPTGSLTVDNLNRRIVLGTGAGPTSVVFGALASPPPLKVTGWVLSGDSTTSPSDVVVQYRFGASDAWKVLNQVDNVAATNGLQFQLVVPSPPMSTSYIKVLWILAEQL